MKFSRYNPAPEHKSKLHLAVGEALAQAPFAGYRRYQEYPVAKLNPDYTNSRHLIDWVVTDIVLAIECMGEQHYRPVRFSQHITAEQAALNLQQQQITDQRKRIAIEDAGYIYLAIPYLDLDLVSPSYILAKYLAEKQMTGR